MSSFEVAIQFLTPDGEMRSVDTHVLVTVSKYRTGWKRISNTRQGRAGRAERRRGAERRGTDRYGNGADWTGTERPGRPAEVGRQQ
ncbi:hypothetical protein AV530_003928 [Patagioenas fasciata monilis]|uniref:Uncharacterized protein n=1 Tax=Patagioenas fasciata monilis TaxID=372326 RepID=A0A1V4KZK0_PATFA|nr:hypothetical protein AV530_003928 [Patagioenas fasciata monilis]